MMIQSVSRCYGAVKMDSEFEILYAYVRSKKQCVLEEKKEKETRQRKAKVKKCVIIVKNKLSMLVIEFVLSVVKPVP